MPEEAKKKKKTTTPPLPSARPPRKSVAFEPPARQERGSLLGPSVPARWPLEPAPPPEPEAPAPLQAVPAHMTLEQRAEHDRIVKEAQEAEAKRQQGFIRDVLDPIWIDPKGKPSVWGYYGGVTTPARRGEGPTFAETLEPLKIFDVLGRGVRKYFTGMSETQLAAPGEQSRLLGNIVTDMLTDPLLVAGLAKAGVAGLRGIRSLLDDVVSAELAGQDPGIAQMFSRVRPEQLDELATQLQQGLLQSGIKRLPPNFQRALVRSLAPGGAIADQRGALHPAYEGMFTKSPSNMYSQMGRALERMLPGSAKSEQLQELLSTWIRKGEFKEQELFWSDLEEFITRKGAGGKRVTKEEILNYVRGNELDVQVVTRQGTETSQNYSNYIEGDPANWSDYQEVLITLPSREARYAQHFQDDTLAWFRTVERKFKDPVTGEERRVLFLEEMQSDWHQKGRQLGYAEEGELAARSDEFEELRELFEEAEGNYETLTDDYGMNADDAYYQLEEAKTRKGDLEYDLETTQSDWNDLDMEADEVVNELQAEADAMLADERQMDLPGTPKREPPPDVEIPEEMQERLDDLQTKIDELESEVRDVDFEVEEAESAHDSLQEAEEQLTEARNDFEGADEAPEEGGKPPRAPFGKTWVELAFKRMLQKAVDDGYDTIAWSRGQVQADRYNAAMHIEDIQYTKGTGLSKKGVEEEQYFIKFRTKIDMENNITTNWREATAPAATLDDWVGKKIANKMRAGEETGLLENDELWLGGEELKFFYDGELRNKAQKLVKRYGGKVTKESMGPTFQVVEIPASADTFTAWADVEIPRLRLAKEALQDQAHKLGALSPPENYRPTLATRMSVLSQRASALANRESMLYAARSRIEHGTGIDKIDPTVLKFFSQANPTATKKFGIRDPTNRTRTGKMVFDTLEEAEAAAAPTVNTIRITSKMREAIVERGWPLYQILMGTTGAAAGTAATAEAMSAHKEGQ